MASQSLMPLSDIATPGWAAFGAGTGVEAIDEGFYTPDDDTTYVYSPTSGGGFIYKFNLGTLPHAVPTNIRGLHRCPLRIKRVSVAGTGVPTNPKLVIAVVQSGTTIIGTKEFFMGSATNSWVDREFVLSPDQVDDITDYDNIDLWLQHASGNKFEIRVTVCQMEVPDPNGRHMMMGPFA